MTMSAVPSRSSGRRVVGLIPAAGHATRLGALPFSKELYPICFTLSTDGAPPRPRLACEWLFDSLNAANVETAYIVTRPAKWDIASQLTESGTHGVKVAYITIPGSPSQSHTLDHAYPFVKDATVALGFADIVFRPRDVFTQLLERQSRSNADVVLAVVPTDRPQKADMIAFDEHGRIHDIIIKPAATSLQHTWLVAIWGPRFTELLHATVAAFDAGSRAGDTRGELYVGEVFRAAIREGLAVDAVAFPDAACIDIGTPDDLIRALQHPELFLNDDPGRTR